MPDFQATDFYNLDELLSDDDRAVRDSVRAWVQNRFLPLVQKYYRAGTFPLELAPELGRLGALGCHIQGYGCAGRSPLAYGLIMQELERGDSGLRTFASVQGRWPCKPFMPLAARSRSSAGCPPWPAARRSAVSA